MGNSKTASLTNAPKGIGFPRWEIIFSRSDGKPEARRYRGCGRDSIFVASPFGCWRDAELGPNVSRHRRPERAAAVRVVGDRSRDAGSRGGARLGAWEIRRPRQAEAPGDGNLGAPDALSPRGSQIGGIAMGLGKGALLWLIGVPIPVIILLMVFLHH